MQKKVARAPCVRSSSSTCGVTFGSGPSSTVMAICPLVAASAGRRVQLEPSRWLRGTNPAATSCRWLAITAASDQGHRCGRQAVTASAPQCRAADAGNTGAGCQRRGLDGTALLAGARCCKCVPLASGRAVPGSIELTSFSGLTLSGLPTPAEQCTRCQQRREQQHQQRARSDRATERIEHWQLGGGQHTEGDDGTGVGNE